MSRGSSSRQTPERRAFSSVGRASPLQGEGQKFESSNAQIKGITKVVPFFIVFI